MAKNTITILIGLALLLAACGNDSAEPLAFGDSDDTETPTTVTAETTTTVPANPFVEIGGLVAGENAELVVLNFAECPAESTTVEIDRGTNTIISLGIEDGECVFQHGASIDGLSPTGAVDQECRVPADHEVQLASYTAGIGVVYERIRDFCQQIPVAAHRFFTGGEFVIEIDENGRKDYAWLMSPIVLNVGDCPVHHDSVDFGQGSHLIAGLGLDGDTCVFAVGTEWEGAGGGELQSECRVDAALGTLEIDNVTKGGGTDFAQIIQFCEPISPPRQVGS